jgi:DNA-binding NarL/FixJ family response regulator
MNPITVLLADDHAVVRRGLRAIIEDMPDATLVGEAENGRDAVAQARRLQPTVVLLDITMPELNGIEAATRISQESPGVRVVMLSMHTSVQYVTAALRAGAMGYVIKESADSELVDAVRAAAAGRSFISPHVSSVLVQALQNPGQTSALESLTSRQREVLQLVAEGQSTKAIAAALHLSPKTVETHRAELMRRLDIRDVAGLTRLAIREGLISGHA